MLFGLIKSKPKEPQIIGLNCVEKCPRDSKCPKWVILNQSFVDKDGKVAIKEEGKCADAWIPIILIELKTAILSKQTNEDKK